jgi:hypothetical protein
MLLATSVTHTSKILYQLSRRGGKRHKLTFTGFLRSVVERIGKQRKNACLTNLVDATSVIIVEQRRSLRKVITVKAVCLWVVHHSFHSPLTFLCYRVGWRNAESYASNAMQNDGVCPCYLRDERFQATRDLIPYRSFSY